MWNTFLGKHIKPLSAEVVLALIPSRICSYQFRNRLDNLTLHSTRTVTFKLVATKDRCSWFTWLYICASYLLLVFVIYCAFIRQYYSLLNYFFSSSFEFCFDCCSKEKRTILNLNSVQVFRSCVTWSTSSSGVNKHHTADSTDFVLV
jgi:hypothetical protein